MVGCMRSSKKPLVWKMIRTSSKSPDPESVGRRAQSFAAASAGARSTTLLLTRDDRELAGFMLADPGRRGSGSDQAALHLAQAVAARAVEQDEPPKLPAVRCVGVLRARSSGVALRDNQLGNPAELSQRMAVAMRAGSWIASVTRTASNTERRRTLRWYEHRLGANPVHHTNTDQSLAVKFIAGGSSRREVTSLLQQMSAALPGFDVASRVSFPSSVIRYLVIGALVVAGEVGAHFAGRNKNLTAMITPGLLGLVVALLGAAAAALVAFGVFPTARRAMDRQVDAASFDRPSFRGAPPQRPKVAIRAIDDSGRKQDGSPGGYPVASSTFIVGPGVLIGLVAPHAGAASGALGTARREAPAVLLDSGIGPAVGSAGEAAALVHIAAGSFKDGIAAIGRKGSGKSLLVRALWAWMALDRVSPFPIQGSPGRRNAMIAFESKGEGARMYQQWSQSVGDQALLVDLADPGSYAIDIFAIGGTLPERVNFILAALVYSFEPGEIQGRSSESLTAAFAGALVLSSPTMSTVGLPDSVQPGRSPMYYAHLILGAYGDGRAVAIAAAVSEARAVAQRTGAKDAAALAWAEDQLGVLFGDGETKVTPAQRRNQTEAARNKLRFLVQAESWWDPSRPKVTWAQILNGHKAVIVNTGIAANGNLVDEKTTEYMSSLLMYSLRDAVLRHCNEWAAAGRWVSVFSDELSLLAGSSPEVIAWFQDKGRSYGAIPVFATQRLDQLLPQVQKIVKDFGTIFWFQQGDPDVARAAALDLSPSGADFSAEDVVNLEPYTAFLRTTVAGVRQPPVPVQLSNFEADIPSFSSVQGGPRGPLELDVSR